MNTRTRRRTRACGRTQGTQTRNPPALLRTRMPLLRARLPAYPHAHAHTRTHARARARAHAQARTRTRTRGGDLGDQTRVCPTANETFYGRPFTGFKRMLKMLNATFFLCLSFAAAGVWGAGGGHVPGPPRPAQPRRRLVTSPPSPSRPRRSHHIPAMTSHPRRDHHVPAMTITSPP